MEGSVRYLIALLISTTMIFSLANAGYAQSSQGKNHGLKFQVEQLQKQVNTLQTELKSIIALAPYVKVDQNAENGVAGPNIVFKGANVHVESGSGATVDSSGLGNLVIGYDEDNGDSSIDNARTGSNNLIIGPGHEFTASGALMAGYQNVSTSNYTVAEGACDAAGANALMSCTSNSTSLGAGEAATVSGGFFNRALGLMSSISGGSSGDASGEYSSISGGYSHIASGEYSSVSGGFRNYASGKYSSVSGGDGGNAVGQYTSISGGSRNRADAYSSSVSGGYANHANGNYSSISGGKGNTTSGPDSSVSGGNTNSAIGQLSVVSGGQSNSASGYSSVVSGGITNAASGDYSSVGGGQNQSATAEYQNVN